MPTTPTGRSTSLATLSATLAGIANDNLADAARQDAAARVLIAARSAADVLAGGAARGEVEALAAAWDPSAVTALEFAEVLPPAELDRLINAAPRWARDRLRAARAAA